jgi:RNA polymerase-binding transcription factor DksA
MSATHLISLPASDGLALVSPEDALRALRAVLEGEVLTHYDRTSLLRLAAAVEDAEDYDAGADYDRGFNDGHRDGRDAGYADANREFSDRLADERSDAAAQGYNEGYAAGVRDQADRAERFGDIAERARARIRERGECERCGAPMNPAERMLGPVCGRCARALHRAVAG